MTKAQMIAELKSDARIYGFNLPKDLEKKSKAEIEIIYGSAEQAVGDYFDQQRDAAV